MLTMGPPLVELHPKLTLFARGFALKIDPRVTLPRHWLAGVIGSDRRGLIERNQTLAFP
jgi:hypothetical protein